MDYSKLTDKEILELGKEQGLIPEEKLAYPNDFLNKVICGDNIEVMKEIPDNSIDTIVTDPPYGLSFMGKKWDYNVPSISIWKECLRVLKPGGTLLCFAGSRTQHRMACNVEDAGFILKDCIMWIYGSGFPKATDISKQLDKGHKRKVIKTINKIHISNSNTNDGWKRPSHLNKDGSQKTTMDITAPTTEEVKLWNGYKSHGLKPAYEPILVAMKPNDGTYANNALKWGVSGLNIDGSRIGTEELSYTSTFKRVINKNIEQGYRPITMKGSGGEVCKTVKGRFPANIILDNKAGKLLDEQSGTLTSGKMDSITKGHDPKTFNTYGTQYVRHFKANGDKGGASRFFKNIPLDSRMIYVPKASKSERNKGLNGESKNASHDGRDKHIENPYQRHDNKQINFHPTVKPLKLMQYLCTLTKCPTGGTVLDPFMGSGTTGLACKNVGRDFIGIEKDEEYCKIAKARINN